MLEIWNKSKIELLDNKDIEQWFDVLNNGLIEDRGYSLTDPDIDKIKVKIKLEYINYLKSCSLNKNFHSYYVLRNRHDKIVSVCRIIKDRENYLLEGLETHRDFYKQGLATELVNKMLHSLKRDGINKINSHVSNRNIASLMFHEKLGFSIIKKDEIHTKFDLNVDKQIRRQLFDDWSSNYNNSVIESEKNGTYPFAGYSEIKYQILNLITNKLIANVLDMGVGTGEITKPLYDLGYHITGVDFSEKMIEIAKEKMPQASFIQGEFTEALLQFKSKYDFVIFNYSIHHLSYDSQIEVLVKLSQYLNNDGMVIIGDVSTITDDDMDKLQKKYELIWDDEENYPILENYKKEILRNLYNIKYMQLNEVSGLYQFIKIT